ncbi:hypothetical protein ACFY2R_09655 [Micromonospora olivasterospora]|uniref:Uncharacterized protein n=1 Tax=Micromonospora olivasterospora TaxID=1880 RepID=A0A562I6X4_MICOL|nr:hypothetical protein [Micromonospora olivasterospora]TWH66662.1 hypothetical protein JD77_01620 [Micromonospora olivasterospora]
MEPDDEGARPLVDSGCLVTWFEVVDPLVARTHDHGPIRDDYSNLYFEGSGRMRAHAGQLARRPGCIPAESQAFTARDSWAKPIPPAIVRCEVCLAAHPVAQVPE